MKDKEAFEKMKAYFKGEEARAIIEREIKRLEEQESGLTDEMMVHYKKLAEYYNGGKHESIQDTDDGK